MLDKLYFIKQIVSPILIGFILNKTDKYINSHIKTEFCYGSNFSTYKKMSK